MTTRRLPHLGRRVAAILLTLTCGRADAEPYPPLDDFSAAFLGI